MRVMTQDRQAGIELADDVPNYPGHSGTFMRRVMSAWIAMGFRRPRSAGARRAGRNSDWAAARPAIAHGNPKAQSKQVVGYFAVELG
jgi:hypothetical protein